MITEKHASFLWYVLECIIGTCVGFAIYAANPVIGAWSLFSIILVVAPDRKDALVLAGNRIKANLIGASIGLITAYFHPFNLFTICIGIALALLVCEWLKLQAVARSALVALLIIAMHEPGPSFWAIALERAAGVMLGCIIGVILTIVFHSAFLKAKKHLAKA